MSERIFPDTLDDILADPTRYGFPTFNDYCKNREKYVGRADDVLSSVDEAGQNLKGYMKKVKYEIEGYRCETLEEVERVAASQGIPLSELDYRAVCIPLTSFSCDILVKFMPKSEIEKRRQHGSQTRRTA